MGLALGSIAAIVAGLAAYGAARWAGSTRALLFRLEGTRLPATTSRYDAHELEGLPAPVKRYFRSVLKDGQPTIAAATVEHAGTFNLNPTDERWKPFTSKQRVVTRRPGFVWNARIAMVPGIAVYVHDAYVDGEGILNPAILGLFSLAGQIDAGDLAQGEFVRFFAETAWYPTALLPSQGVHWDAADDHSATATLADGKVSVTMLVSFNDAGLIEPVRVEARAARVGNAVVPTPWEGHMSNYQERDGMLVPLTAEASWLRLDGRKPYWRGTITSITYEFPSPGPSVKELPGAIAIQLQTLTAARSAALKAIKAAHTVVWTFFAGCTLAIPFASWRDEHRAAAWLAAIVLVEAIVLLLNRWRCPLSSVAERYTADRRATFDIYLPEWFAKHNKSIFGALYFVGVVFALAHWLHAAS
jgi:hypothetical protein